MLGGLRKPRARLTNRAWRNASFRGYADHMLTPHFRGGGRRAAGCSAKSATVAVMCAEAVWWQCHRMLLSDALARARRRRAAHPRASEDASVSLTGSTPFAQDSDGRAGVVSGVDLGPAIEKTKPKWAESQSN